MIPDPNIPGALIIHPAIVARFDRVDRNVMAAEAALHAVAWHGREVEEITVSKLQRQIFLNLFLCAILFGFALLACIFEPSLLHFTISAGLCGCLYTGMLINNFAVLLFRGMGG
ncbi:MAG TPA: hypothetical protein VGK47_11340 [Nitrososphaeraceae archaeon]